MFVADPPQATPPAEPGADDGVSSPPSGLAGLPLELIEREIEELAAHVNAGTARWLELVGEFDRRTGWANTGCRSTSEWVAWRCALTSRSAREHVRVARALPELPLIREAFSRGELSYSKVRALTRVADADSEAELIELARHATAAQLERMVRAARRASTTDADEAQRTSFLRYCWDEDDGCLRIEAKLPPEDGALFLRALEAARDALYEQRLADATEEREDAAAERGGGSAGPLAASEPSGSAEPSPARGGDARTVPSPTNAESFAALSDAALARPPTGLAGGDRYQVLVHVDSSTLATDEPGASVAGPGRCAISDGPGIAAETARRLACEASLVTLVERDGEPFSVGRRRRSVPPSIRRALNARDGRCQFPGCERHRFVDAHHIRHWAKGGETSLDNLVLLCRRHHRLVHEGGYSLARAPDGRLAFKWPDGRPLPSSPAPPHADGSRLPRAPGRLLTGTSGAKARAAPAAAAPG